MILLRRLLPATLGLVTAALIYATLLWPDAIAFLALVLGTVLWMGVGALTRSSLLAEHERWWHIAMTPLVFCGGVILFLLFTELTWMYVVLSLAAGVFVLFFCEHVFRFMYVPALYQPYALEYFSLFLHVASVYVFSAALFGLQTFLQTPIWLLIGLMGVVVTLLTYETLWVSKIRDAQALKVSLMLGAVATEWFVVLTMLPISFYVSAAAMAVFFYMMNGMTRAFLLQKLSRDVLRRYVWVGCACILLLFLTAQWV